MQPFVVGDSKLCEERWNKFVETFVETTQYFTFAELRTAFIAGWAAALKDTPILENVSTPDVIPVIPE